MTSTIAGGPTLPQERRLVTDIPGPRSIELLARKKAAVADGVGTDAADLRDGGRRRRDPSTPTATR